ncbi:hypothetical protein STRTUCAR8_03634, partial [Streptomyces turgidiscabies Car8]
MTGCSEPGFGPGGALRRDRRIAGGGELGF